jgi:hypothetical protein
LVFRAEIAQEVEHGGVAKAQLDFGTTLALSVLASFLFCQSRQS